MYEIVMFPLGIGKLSVRFHRTKRSKPYGTVVSAEVSGSSGVSVLEAMKFETDGGGSGLNSIVARSVPSVPAPPLLRAVIFPSASISQEKDLYSLLRGLTLAKTIASIIKNQEIKSLIYNPKRRLRESSQRGKSFVIFETPSPLESLADAHGECFDRCARIQENHG